MVSLHELQNSSEGTELKVEVLGQLLLMQNVMCNLPDQKSIISFVCRGLLDVPGVTEVHYSESRQQANEPAVIHFPLLLGKSNFGELVLRLADFPSFSPYAQYLDNFCFTVAVILEERNKRREIELHHLELEQRVEARTKELSEEIAERKLIEKEREELIRKLRTQNAELERFNYSVSHDLKCPLITIQGYVGMLAEELALTKHASALDLLASISKAADKLNQLLNDLLELSRIGRLASCSEDIPLGELVNEVLEVVRGRIEASGASVEVAPNLPVVYGNRSCLLQVLQNLVENAVKYSGDDNQPRIEIGARQEAEEAICYVRDNGLGIEPMYHEKVFGLFEQLNPTAEGTGIGLAIAKRIVEAHRGHIWVESEGKRLGSTFWFTIPAIPPRVDAEHDVDAES